MDDQCYHIVLSRLLDILIYQSDISTNIPSIYNAIKNKQIHFEMEHDKDQSLRETCKNIAQRHGFTVTFVTCASIGVDHNNALFICRQIAQKFGSTFESSHVDCIEEGELRTVPELATFQHESYLYPVRLYSLPRFHIPFPCCERQI